ncbi:unknown [Clostridium sp. CAG:448]|nr:unknown [Clostridium sp. CAG:448]
MRTAVQIVEFDGVAEHIDNDAVDFVLFNHAPVDQRDQPALFCVKPDGVVHTAGDYTAVKGAVDIVGNAHVISTPDRGGGCVFRNGHDRDVIDQMIVIHVYQRVKAAFSGHDNIQEHQGNIGAVLLQRRNAGIHTFCLQNPEILVQHGAQNFAVEFGIVYQKDDRHFCHQFFVGKILFGADSVFLAFGKQHDFVRTAYCLFDRFVLAFHGADADREMNARESGDLRIADPLADSVQHIQKAVGADGRDNEQKFVSAVADQHIGFAQTAADGVDHCAENRIADVVSVQIVVKLEVVRVHHGNAGVQIGVAYLFLIVSAVVDAGQHVGIDFVVVECELIQQSAAPGKAVQKILIQFRCHLDHTRFAVNNDVFCHALPYGVADRFQFVADSAVPIGTRRNAVIAHPLRIVAEKAIGGDIGAAACRKIFQDVFAQQAYTRKQSAQVYQFLLCLLLCQLFRQSVLSVHEGILRLSCIFGTTIPQIGFSCKVTWQTFCQYGVVCNLCTRPHTI